MKLHNNLDETLNQASKVKVFRFLFAEKDEHTGRGIAKGIGMSPSATHKVLSEMRAAGILNARRKGNAILYKLKENNYFVKRLLAVLFEREKSVYGDVVAFIRKGLLKHKKGVVSLCIFGSVAVGAGTSRSDIDLLVIIKSLSAKNRIDKSLDKMSIDLAKEFGIALSPYILTGAVFKRRYSKKQRLTLSILKNYRLIYGEPLERVIA